MTPSKFELLLTLGVIAGAIVAGLIVHRIVFWILKRAFAGRSEKVVPALIARARAPLAFILPLVAVTMALPDAQVPPNLSVPLEHLAAILSYVAIGWGMAAAVGLFADVTIARYRLDVEDNLRAREVETRLAIIGRSLKAFIWLLAVAAILFTFPNIRTLGATLLASAGLAGIIAGVAARPVVENLLAGLQIALAQPIRLDDVVVLADGSQGRVEEIRDTFVVLRLVDLRRVILPLTYFITTPFQNLTLKTSELNGNVTVFAPYAFGVDALREELPKILEGTALWDHREAKIQVVDVTENTIKVNARVSARNASDLFDLCCLVREKLAARVGSRPSA